MTKKERQQVFDKCGGRCAYCGEQLHKGWHVDHKVAIRRKRKLIPACYKHRDTGEELTAIEARRADFKFDDSWVYIPGKFVPDGCENPEMECMENYLPACASCNINKHQMDAEQFRAQISGFVTSLNNNITQYKMAKRYGLVAETVKPIVFYYETLAKPLN